MHKEKILLHQDWQFRQIGQQEWRQAQVPGTIHTDLLTHQLVADPFYGKNEEKQQWIGERDWEYQCAFELNKCLIYKDEINLVFEGVDTYAFIYLNGELILSPDNMFRAWKVPIKSLLKEGKNNLRIYFRSAIHEALPLYESKAYTIPVSLNDQGDPRLSIYSRKAGYHFGWDWGPRFVTCGLWKSAYIEAWNIARLNSLYIQQENTSSEKVDLNFQIEIDSNASEDLGFEVYLNNEAQAILNFSGKLSKGLNQIQLPYQLPNPKLWWPNGLGEAYLYQVKVILKKGEEILDEIQQSLGIRHVELVREPDELGTSFYFRINGEKVFMKGANYIPQDNFLNRVSDQHYEKLLNAAEDAHMNMIRVWGGGIYEKDIFYQLCDEKGILIWQDFMFACAMYPGDAHYLENIQAEAAYQVKRLRNHPCIVLWCGNNESLEAWHRWGWKEKLASDDLATREIWTAYERIFYEILPQAVAQYDPQTVYWPSSPSSSFNETSNLQSGDVHYWDVWHGELPYEHYEQNVGRFMSEYGFQSFPPFETVKSYTSPDDYAIESEVMLFHQRNPRGNMLIQEYMQRDYPEPKDFESFLYISNVLQADIIKYAIETHRQHMPYCMGSLYWQLNDCWPVASWSGIDYYGRWKALHYAVKEAFQPLLVSPRIRNNHLFIYIISDWLGSREVSLTWQLMDFYGRIQMEFEMSVPIIPNAVELVYQDELSTVLHKFSKEEVLLRAQIKEDQKILSENVLYFTKPKNLKLPVPTIHSSIERQAGGYEITLNTQQYVPSVFLSLKDETINFSENYINIFPNEPKLISCNSELSLSNFEQALSIRSLTDAF